MTDLFEINLKSVPSGMTYSWLDLKNRGWVDVEFLPNGWERVPYARHAGMFTQNPKHDFIEFHGLTLCEQETVGANAKQSLTWVQASNMASDWAVDFRDHVRDLGLIPVSDGECLEPPDSVELFTTRHPEK